MRKSAIAVALAAVLWTPEASGQTILQKNDWRARALDLSFQEVVHSVRTGNADFAKRSDSRRTEWTPTKMPA
jgi:hypothetical protein